MTSLHPHHNGPMNWRPRCALADWQFPAAGVHLVTRVHHSPDKPFHIGVLQSIDQSHWFRRFCYLLGAVAWRQSLAEWLSAWRRPLHRHSPTPIHSRCNRVSLSRTQPIWWIGLISTASIGGTQDQHRHFQEHVIVTVRASSKNVGDMLIYLNISSNGVNFSTSTLVFTLSSFE